MPATITTVKAALASLALLCAVFQWTGLHSHLSYQGHHRLAAAVGEGRLETVEAGWMDAALDTPLAQVGYVSPQSLRDFSLLHMYNVDLIAASKGLSPLRASQDPDLSAARLEAMKRLKATLSRTPLDGDLWLRLALLARAEKPFNNNANHYLKLSQKVTPHEGWILKRRPDSTR